MEKQAEQQIFKMKRIWLINSESILRKYKHVNLTEGQC